MQKDFHRIFLYLIVYTVVSVIILLSEAKLYGLIFFVYLITLALTSRIKGVSKRWVTIAIVIVNVMMLSTMLILRFYY